MALITHPHLVPRLRKEYSYISTLLLGFCAFYRVNLSFHLLYMCMCVCIYKKNPTRMLNLIINPISHHLYGSNHKTVC